MRRSFTASSRTELFTDDTWAGHADLVHLPSHAAAHRPAAVLAACVVAASVVGCGASGSAPRATPSPPSAASLALRYQADAVFEAFDGTVVEREARDRLRAWAVNGAMDVCMAGEGFPEWDWSATTGPAPRTDALATSVLYAAPLAHTTSDSLRDTVQFLRSEEELQSGEPPTGQDPAIDRCLSRRRSAPDDQVGHVSEPHGVAHLREQWWEMLRGWDVAHGDVTAYDACFADGSEDFSVDAAEVGAWRAELVRRAPRADDIPPIGVDEDSFAQAWKDFLALEASLEEIDWSCRAEVYETHYAEVSSDVQAFAQDHAAEVAAIAIGWADVVARAAELPDPLT